MKKQKDILRIPTLLLGFVLILLGGCGDKDDTLKTTFDPSLLIGKTFISSKVESLRYPTDDVITFVFNSDDLLTVGMNKCIVNQRPERYEQSVRYTIKGDSIIGHNNEFDLRGKVESLSEKELVFNVTFTVDMIPIQVKCIANHSDINYSEAILGTWRLEDDFKLRFIYTADGVVKRQIFTLGVWGDVEDGFWGDPVPGLYYLNGYHIGQNLGETDKPGYNTYTSVFISIEGDWMHMKGYCWQGGEGSKIDTYFIRLK
ncbi:hypothetical protein [Parabacteroides timonensis]|uniref:hypothetical protein n=1 Tax=Parabacteroides timonensis TaxID=1871013 RepID=UPI00094E3FB7|nr:hypothetical protein [Parabacteroides timonensis]